MGGKYCKEKLLQMKSIVVDFSGQMLTPDGGNKKFKTLAKLLDFLQKKILKIYWGRELAANTKLYSIAISRGPHF